MQSGGGIKLPSLSPDTLGMMSPKSKNTFEAN